MPDLGILRDILVLLTLALGGGYLFTRLHLSPIVGYLVTGIIAGPYGFLLIEAVHEVEVMAEVGVILLLFTIGLEFSFTRLLRLRKLMLVGGGTQVLITSILVFGATVWMGLPLSAAGALAMALCVSSTAIVLKLLLERGEVDTAHGRTSLAILLFQDLCVVFFLIGLPFLGGRAGGFSPVTILRSVLLLALLFLFARYLMQPLLRGLLRTRSPELFRLSILAMVLATAWITSVAGLSLALGAFLAGLALAESPYAHQALSDILPFRDTFLALFFISIGMLVNVHMLAENWPLLLGLFLLLSAAKIFSGAVAAIFSRYPLRIAVLTGLFLFQVGEFSFVLLRQAQGLNLIPEDAYQITLAIIALSMVVTPLLVRYAPAVAGTLPSWGGLGERAPEVEEKTANLAGHAIIAGYGLSGRTVGRVLREMNIPYLHIEMNGETVRNARQAGEFIVYGDATSATVLKELGIEKARAMVLAINDPSALARAIQTARNLNPDIYILARTRFLLELDHLSRLGADEIIPDELEASLHLSASLLRRFEIAEGRILQLLTALRSEHYDRLLKKKEIPSGGFSVLEGGSLDFLPVPDGSPCLGKSLADLGFRTHTGTMVVGVIRRERTIFSPPADLVLERGDTLMILGGESEVRRARKFLRGA